MNPLQNQIDTFRKLSQRLIVVRLALGGLRDSAMNTHDPQRLKELTTEICKLADKAVDAAENVADFAVSYLTTVRQDDDDQYPNSTGRH